MGVGIGNTVEGFRLFYDYLWDREFRKTVSEGYRPLLGLADT